MMGSFQSDMLMKILKGLGTAVLITIGGMAILAGFVILTPITDQLLTVLNQVLKVVSIFMGAYIAVGCGGERGFAIGALVGLVYMVLGYLVYSIIDGMLAPAPQMALEFFLGLLIGAVSGAITANLKPKHKKRKVRPA